MSIIEYNFTDSGNLITTNPVCFCGADSVQGVDPVYPCCDVTATLGPGQIVRWNFTEAIYRLEITVENNGPPTCSPRTIQLSGSNIVTRLLAPGTHYLNFTLPVTGGSLDINFTNTCSGLTDGGTIVVPGVPCCPFQLVFGTPVRVGNTSAFDIDVSFNYTSVVGCQQRGAVVESSIFPRTVLTTSTRIRVNTTGGTDIDFTVSNICGDIIKVENISFPRLCCTPTLTITDEVYVHNPPNLNLSYTFLLTESTNCDPQVYTLQSAEFATRPITVNTPVTVSFTVPDSREGEIFNVNAVGDCTTTNVNAQIPTTPLPCCPSNVELTRPFDLSTPGSITVYFRVVENTRNCTRGAYEYIIGTDLQTGITDSSIIPGVETVFTFPITTDSEVIIQINNSCDDSEVDTTFPICCPISISNFSFGPEGVVPDRYFVQFNLDQVGDCTTEYTVVLNGQPYPFPLTGNTNNYLEFDDPRGTFTSSLVITNPCSGQVVTQDFSISPPICCNYFIDVGNFNVISDNSAGVTFRIFPSMIDTGPPGCTPNVAEFSSPFFSRRPVATTDFTVPLNQLSQTINFVFYTCAGEDRRTYNLPFPCCTYSASFSNIQNLGTSGGLNNYSALLTITPNSFGPCVNRFLRLAIRTTGGVFTPVDIFYNASTVTYTANFSVPIGTSVARFDFTDNCNPGLILDAAVGPPPCCALQVTNQTVTGTGRINTFGDSEWEVRFDLGFIPNTPPGCSPAPTSTLDYVYTGVIPVTFGTNTFRMFAPINNNNNGIFRNGLCSLTRLISTPQVFANCCNFVPPNLAEVFAIPTGNPNEYTVDFNINRITNSPNAGCQSFGYEYLFGPNVLTPGPIFLNEGLTTVTILANPPSTPFFSFGTLRNRCGTFAVAVRIVFT